MRSFYSPRQKTTCILLPWDIRRKLPVIVLNQSPNAYFDVSFFFKQGYEAVPFARGNLKSAFSTATLSYLLCVMSRSWLLVVTESVVVQPC